MKFPSCCSTNPIKPWLITFFVIKILYMCTHAERLSGCADKYRIRIRHCNLTIEVNYTRPK